MDLEILSIYLLSKSPVFQILSYAQKTTLKALIQASDNVQSGGSSCERGAHYKRFVCLVNDYFQFFDFFLAAADFDFARASPDGHIREPANAVNQLIQQR
ncbi:MAG: hypothetical protein QNJ69_12670 [Gammaproteobacteria bacterium]|nr:hypothetical protein [Gammaproteobacteria bacterium]